jgi:hypoxanthine phosphoribosyltransferase
METTKTNLTFQEISRRIRKIPFPTIDLVIGIATGGTVPASLVAFHLNVPLQLITINYRDEDNTPRFDTPHLINQRNVDLVGKEVLLVDDVSVSGKTLAFAKSFLQDCEVITFVMKGNADISVFPEITNCVQWPWKN